MALPVNIDDLIHHRKVECARIEYKEGWNPERVLHTICAFANDIDNWGGGYVIIGVKEENGRPVFPVKGIDPDSVDQIQKELLNVCHQIEPVYLPIVEPSEYEGKQLLIIWVPGGYERPYSCPEKIVQNAKSPRAYYIRKLASTVKANRAQERELFDLAGDVPFDDRPNMQAEVADLKVNLMAEYLRDVGSGLYPAAEEMSVMELAKHLRIVSGSNELRKPLNVGLMFFNPHPENFFRYAWIEVVDKPDPTGQGMVEKYFKGPLHHQLRGALDFIKNYVLKEKIFKVSGRAEADRHWNYPYDAIEEALVNAVYHKSYQRAEPVKVIFTADRMEITSIPGPDRSIRDEDMAVFKLFSRLDRNRRVGEFLKELDLAEGRNTGYPAILKALAFNGSPMPIVETNEERDYFTFVMPIHPCFLGETAESDPVTDPVSDPVSDPVDSRVIEVLRVLNIEAATSAYLREKLSISHRKFFRDNYLNPAIRGGLIISEEGLSLHNPHLRYFITDKGRMVLGK